MKNPFLSSQTLLEKMGRTRSKTPDRSSKLPESKPSLHKQSSLPPPEQPSSYNYKQTSSPFMAQPKPQFSRTNFKSNYESVETTKTNDNPPYYKPVPQLKIQQYGYQSNGDVFSQERSTTSHKFEDVSLNIQLSPIHSKRNQDMSILPLTDSLLMQCLAKTQTRDELAKLLGIEEKRSSDAVMATFGAHNNHGNRNQDLNNRYGDFEHVNFHLNPEPIPDLMFKRKPSPIHAPKNIAHNESQDEFDFQQFKSQNNISDSIIQNRLPKVMKYQPGEITTKQPPKQMYETLPRFNQQIKVNVKINLLEKINKQMEPLYQKDNIKIFLTATDKITMKQFQLTE